MIHATAVPRKRIGRHARIGAGAVVTKDVPEGETWIGNPARPLVSREAAGVEAFDPGRQEWNDWWERSRAPLSTKE